MTMSGPQRISAEAFAVDLLREDPNLDYAVIRERARAAGVSMHPIHYGRARKQLGLPALTAARFAPPPTPPAAEPRPAPLDLPTARDPAPPAVGDGQQGEPGPIQAPPAPGTELVAPRRRGSPAFDHLVQLLRNEPHALFADLRDRCAEKGFQIAPIMYGRAKAVLGLVPVKPRGSKAPAAVARPAAATAPLQLKQVESVAADRFARKLEEVRNLDQLVAIVKDLDGERRRLRAVLERVIDILDEALGP